LIVLGCLGAGPGAPTSSSSPESVPDLSLPPAASSLPGAVPKEELEAFDVYFARQAYIERGAGEGLLAARREASSVGLLQSALDALYAGPTPEELQNGMVLLSCGTTGASLEGVRDGIAYVVLEGNCGGCGAFGLFELMHATVVQFPEVRHLHLREQDGAFSSRMQNESVRAPCLEP
jgi:hypothetical protein